MNISTGIPQVEAIAKAQGLRMNRVKEYKVAVKLWKKTQ
jgi:hypothetical protein